MIENRRKPRQRTFKGGSIMLPTGTVDCIVRNVSATGALLELKAPALVPNDFDLIIKPEGTRRCCHVVHRDTLRLGVHFVSGL
jgi:hypothetical protein